MPLSPVPAPTLPFDARVASLDALFHAAPMGIALTVERRFVEVNDQLCAMSGYSRNELIGQTTRIIQPSDTQYRELSETLYPQLESQRVAQIDTELRRKDGQILEVALRLALIDPGQPSLGVVSTVLDISEYVKTAHLLKTRAVIAAHAAKRECRALIERVLTDALSLTRSTAARIEIPETARGSKPCVGLATLSEGGLAPSMQVSSTCRWTSDADTGTLPASPRASNADTRLSIAGLASADELSGTSLEVEAANQEDRTPSVHLQVKGKAADYTESDRRLLQELALLANDAVDTLRTAVASRVNETRAQLALNAARDGVWDWDVRRGVVTVNGAYFAMLGREDSEGALDIAEWRAIIHPHDQAAMQERVEALLQTDESAETDYRLRRADGGWCWVRSRAQVAERDVEGHTLRVIGTHADITRIKEAERQALQLQSRLETALASMQDAVMICDAEGNLIHLNQAFARFHRFQSVADCAAHFDAYPQLIEVSFPDGTPALLSQWAIPRALRGETAVDQVYRLRRKDTGESWIGNYNLAPIYDADGSVSGCVVTGTDITERIRAEEHQAQLKDMLARTEQIAKVGSWEWDIETDSVIWSDELYRLLDVDPARGPLTYAEKEQVFTPEANERLDRAVARTISTGEPYALELEVVGHDRSIKQLHARGFPKRDAGGKISSLYGFMRDVTEQRRANAEQRLAAGVFAHSLNGILIADGELRILDVNPRFTEMTGFAKDELHARPLASVLADGHPPPEAMMRPAPTADEVWQGEALARRKDLPPFAAMLALSGVPDVQGAVEKHILVVSDITVLKAHEAHLDQLAHHDPLTGLPNRRLLTDRLEQAIALADRSGTFLAVCYVDLDGFKPINDQYGHEVGDQFLITVAGILRDSLRGHDSVARLGGDEFALMLTQLQRPDDCDALLRRILKRVHEPILLEGVHHQITASIGVALYPSDRAEPDALLRHADQAMYRAKQSGKNHYQLYDAEQERGLQERRLLHEELAQALEQDALVLHFQPQVDLIEHTVIGVEALVRWQHPHRGLLPPGAFLPAIEASALEPPLSDWVIESALKQLAQWTQEGLQLRLGINVSAGQLMAPDFAMRLRDQLARHPEIDPSQVEIEVLESTAFSDFEQAQRVLEDCHALGVRFALDDFGTGYSSLAYLRALPVDVLKIDQSFVRDVLDDPSDMAIVENVVRLAQSFNRSVIAEGVETQVHAALVTWLGCRYGQGYGIARPMPAPDLAGWIAQWTAQPAGWLSAGSPDSRDDIQLMIAAQSHLAWVNRVVRILNAQDVPQSVETSPDHCIFGRWYNDRGAEQFGGLENYRAIGADHRQVHLLAQELLTMAEKGHRASARTRLPELYATRDAFIARLAALVRDVQSTL